MSGGAGKDSGGERGTRRPPVSAPDGCEPLEGRICVCPVLWSIQSLVHSKHSINGGSLVPKCFILYLYGSSPVQ